MPNGDGTGPLGLGKGCKGVGKEQGENLKNGQGRGLGKGQGRGRRMGLCTGKGRATNQPAQKETTE